MRTIENIVARVEKIVNQLDWVPFISTFSGMIRILAGIVQVVAGAIFTGLKVFYNVLFFGRGYFIRSIEQGSTYSVHGIANIVRGAIAMHPILNMGLFIYDKYVGRMNYELEAIDIKFYPIMTAHRGPQQYGRLFALI